MRKVGLICRSDKSGLGQGQTLRLYKLLNPDKVMLINSGLFNGSDQHPDWFGLNIKDSIESFPTNQQVSEFLKGLDIVISCELFYNKYFTTIANNMRVKTILIANPEFMDWFKPEFANIPPPTKVVVPSYWMFDEMRERFNAEYLPTPIFKGQFQAARETNLKRRGKRKYLFINGKTAAHDRNGLHALYEALQLAKGDFTVTVKAQNDIKKHPDPRLIYDFTNPDDQNELYEGFDALIQPRRYGGQTLSMMEALMSALPVIMTDIEPNNNVLPNDWLVPANKTGEFMTRIMIDIYSADSKALAKMLDDFKPTPDVKAEAYELAQEYEAENLREKYMELLK